MLPTAVTPNAITPYARAAWANGWATVDDPDAFPIGPAGHASLTAALTAAEALQDHPGVLRHVTEAGRTAAARTALHRARLRLYATHSILIKAAAAPLTAGARPADLAHLLVLTADQPRKTRQAQAVTHLTTTVASTPGLAISWSHANETASAAAAARGYAEAAATPTGGGPPDPAHVAAGITAAAALGTAASGTDWVTRQLTRTGWNLAGLNLKDSTDPAGDVTTVLDQAAGIVDQAEDDMHAAMTAAFGAYFDTGPGTGLGLIAWVTEEDDAVCPDCDQAEADGPYQPDDLPDMPDHPRCRCWFELA